MVETWHDYKYKNPFQILYQWLGKHILKNADFCLPHGTNAKMYCIMCGVSEERIFVFNYCSGDLAKSLNNSNGADIFDINTRNIVILYLGRLAPVKGVRVLIEAYAKLEKDRNDIFLLIAGDGEEKDKLHKIANGLGIKNIRFYGLVQAEKVAQLISKSDLLVLPSIEKDNLYEGWGLVICEAMSLSKPVIATDAVGCAPDLIQNNHNGFIVKNGDVLQLYEAMRRIVSDSELRTTMGNNSRNEFEKFSNLHRRIKILEKAITLNRN